MAEALTAETTPKPLPVRLTAPALAHFREAMAREGLGSGYGVRIGVTEGGCSGFSYEMGFDDSARPGDLVGEQDGIPIFVSAESVKHLEGVVIDYVQSLTSAGFKFVNPNATRTCGCGTSFS